MNNLNWKTAENQRLIRAVLALKTAPEAEKFLRDLLTAGEITEFAKRFQVAELLNSGVPYSVIEKETGFSSTTVARVAKWLNDGCDGYRLIINRLHHATPNQLRKGLS